MLGVYSTSSVILNFVFNFWSLKSFDRLVWKQPYAHFPLIVLSIIKIYYNRKTYYDSIIPILS